MHPNSSNDQGNDVVYDCTLGKHTVVLVSGEIIIDCVVETEIAVDEPRIDIHV